MCIIIGNLRQFIGHCPIPLDPWWKGVFCFLYVINIIVFRWAPPLEQSRITAFAFSGQQPFTTIILYFSFKIKNEK